MDAVAGPSLTEPQAPRKKPSSWRHWLLWIALSIASYWGFFLVMTMPPVYSFVMRGFVDIILFNSIMPNIGMFALVAPVLGLLALILRVWRPLALGLIAFCAASLFAYSAFVQYRLHNQPPLGTGFEHVGRD